MNTARSMSAPARVLLVDDDPLILAAARLALARDGMDVVTASDSAGAQALLAATGFDVVVLDMNFTPGLRNGAEGIACLKALLRLQPAVPVLVTTGFAGVSVAVEAMRAGAANFITKPWSNDRLVGAVRELALAPATPDRRGSTAGAAPMPDPSPEDLNLERRERQLIATALERAHHNISVAARELGLTRAALYRRMEKHGL